MLNVLMAHSRLLYYCAVYTVQPLEVMGRQEIQQPSPVEINLAEMGPFISDVSQTQLQPQVC